MWYVKNLPVWERGLRLLAALLMTSCAWHYGFNPVGIAFGIAGAVGALTAVVGFCPMCAMAGRRLRKPAGSDGLR